MLKLSITISDDEVEETGQYGEITNAIIDMTRQKLPPQAVVAILESMVDLIQKEYLTQPEAGKLKYTPWITTSGTINTTGMEKLLDSTQQ